MRIAPKPQFPSGSLDPEKANSPAPESGAKLQVVAQHKLRTGDSFVADALFRSLVIVCAVALMASVAVILYQLVRQSSLSISKFGFSFLVKSVWDPVEEVFGAAPLIYGTLVSSFLALVIAVPLSLATALFLTELCPRRLRPILSLLVELLAAIPSVIYGLWGIFVLAPFLRAWVQPFLGKYLGWTGLFTGPKYGFGMLAAGVILAIMILPIISSITREVIVAVPRQQREAALALGATKWEMLRISVLRNVRAGVLGAIILGLGRAFGETMAVLMVIGNRAEIDKSLFAPGSTLASSVANQFTEAVGNLHLSALMECALVLFAITLVVNALAGLLIWSITRGMPSRAIA